MKRDWADIFDVAFGVTVAVCTTALIGGAAVLLWRLAFSI